MNTKPFTTQRTGLLLACGIIALTAPVKAGKPPKDPPPEPEPAPVTFTVMDAGSLGDEDDGLYPVAINDHGVVAGTFTPREFWANDPHYGPIYSWTNIAFLLEPVDGAYYQDADGDGANDLVQLLTPYSDSDRSWAVDINNHGQIIGQQEFNDFEAGTQVHFATVWEGGEIVFEMPNAEFYDINDAGVIAGVTWPDEGSPYYNPDHIYDIPFLLLSLDVDGDGRPDTWYADDNGDGINDQFRFLQLGARPLAVFDDLSVLCTSFVLVQPFEYIPTPSIIRPDFSDADGDGNPWYANADGDRLNDLLQSFPDGAGASVTTGGGLAAGTVDRDVALFDATTVSWFDLDWIDPNAKPSGGRAEACALNDAAWIAGMVYDKQGNGKSVFWCDGALWNFEEIASGASSGVPRAISQAGVIVGNRGYGIFVAFPSVSP